MTVTDMDGGAGEYTLDDTSKSTASAKPPSINDPCPPLERVQDLGKVIAPHSRTYAAIRMDPEATVRALDDPEAMEEARSMSPKTYLVFVDMKIAVYQYLSLPWPQSRYFEYLLRPIAPCLRAEDPRIGFTSDMVVPIYPNTSHPSGREPIHTDPEFPFSNCYHWIGYFTKVYVRTRPELFDHSEAVVLPWSSLEALEAAFDQDRDRIASSRHGRSEPSPSEPSVDSPPEEDAWPVVDLWFNLTEHLDEKLIPNPEDFMKERETISAYAPSIDLSPRSP
ncbi:hypothetical protein L226DRAFT_524449 [Lentinus tigrinus ALCF2SS1-7]|uniref:uncharacterized protein n=1 Tax=Lentinus tigrinus ALCF2SS1-7 TaxID=1328758 RepID=UPI001165D90B|nr:hypothetical protein L226DRAFT_524449 [Lentinus tigrinus ALCF2SS1-7]